MKHLKAGTEINTPYGKAKITKQPDAHGVAKIKYSTGDTESLNTQTEQFTVTVPKS